MARFEDISEEDLTLLLENRDSLSTKNVIRGGVSVLKKYCGEKSVPFPSESVDSSEFNALLSKFYPAARTADGQLYSKKSLLSIRYGLQKHFEKVMGIDIVNSPEFSSANKVFHAMLTKLKQEGKAKVHHQDPLTQQDLLKLYKSLDTITPSGLQNKVFVDFMIYFCNRGRENLRDIKKTDFICSENETYIEMRDMATKNHKGGIHDDVSQGGRIYRTGTTLCPYTSFMKYISMLNPKCDTFFQKPKPKADCAPWYNNVPLGKNTLGDKMKNLSAAASLSKVYTNHCLRATSITLLNGYEARHVMAVSGHKSESSIRSYARTSDDQKKKMALTLAEAVSDGRGIYQIVSVKNTSISLQTVKDAGNQNIVISRVGRSILVGPIVGDGFRSDIFITNDNSFIIGSGLYIHKGANVLLKNNGNGTFTDQAVVYGLEDVDENSRSSVVGDLNKDGLVDLFYANWLGPSRAYLRTHNNDGFLPINDDVITQSTATEVLLLTDFDNDGNADLLKTDVEETHTDRSQNKIMTLNESANSTIITVTRHEIPDETLKNIRLKGAAAVDLDGDGIVELFVSHDAYQGETVSVFQERSRYEYNWIRISPITTYGAPVRGAMVTVTLSDFSQRSIVIGGECSYMCQSEPIAHFGLGNLLAKEVVVIWPGGHTLRHFLYDSNDKITIRVRYSGIVEYVSYLSGTKVDLITSSQIIKCSYFVLSYIMASCYIL